MASTLMKVTARQILSSKQYPILARALSTSSSRHSDGQDGWFSKLWVRKIEPTKESHSRLLSDKDMIYEMQTHNIRGDCVDKYVSSYEKYCQLLKTKDLNMELVGSWSVIVGDQDQAVHIWRYTGGYAEIDKARNMLNNDKDYTAIMKEQGSCLRARHIQYMLSFSFWPQIENRSQPHIYEVRSYVLKPGTMIEWGNNWARAINYRRENDESFAGFFSQVGRLYNVHHIWAYSDLQGRKETREAAWRKPGWDECVAYTVPLIQQMHTRIMAPLPFSPTK